MKTPKKNVPKPSVKKNPSKDGKNAVGETESPKRFVDDDDDDFDLPIDDIEGFDELDTFADDDDY